jgi:L-fucose mutarotase/ribose pyranase (RbsD/FucU family)
MAIYAIINNGQVENVIVADAEFASQVAAESVVLIDNLNPQPAIGWLYNSETQIFTDPNPPEE